MSGACIMTRIDSQTPTSLIRPTSKDKRHWRPSMRTWQMRIRETITDMVCPDSSLISTSETNTSSVLLKTSSAGNGRRLCPGIHLADRNLFHAISKILWAFDLQMATDKETGRPIVPDTSIVTGYREGLTACVNNFPIRMTVRSEKRRETIQREFERVQQDVFQEYEDMNLF